MAENPQKVTPEGAQEALDSVLERLGQVEQELEEARGKVTAYQRQKLEEQVSGVRTIGMVDGYGGLKAFKIIDLRADPEYQFLEQSVALLQSRQGDLARKAKGLRILISRLESEQG